MLSATAKIVPAMVLFLLVLLAGAVHAETETELGNKLKEGIDAAEEGLNKLDKKAGEVGEKADGQIRQGLRVSADALERTAQKLREAGADNAGNKEPETQEKTQEKDDNSWWKFWQ